MDHRKLILDAFDSYCEVTGLAPATVSTKVANDGKFYDRVKEGAGFTTKRYERIMQWFKDNKPKRKQNGHAHD